MRYVLIALIGLIAKSSSAQLSTPLLPPQALDEKRADARADLRPTSVTHIDDAKKKTLWFPIHSQQDADAFWGSSGTKVLSSGALLLEDKVFGANLELLSDIVGYFRVGLQVTAAAADASDETQAAIEDSDEKEAAARLANAGGVLRMTAALPLFYRSAPTFNSTWALLFSATGATEAPKNGGFLENPAATAQSGLELFYQRGGVNHRIDFEFGVTARGYWFNNTYASKAGSSDNTAAIIAPRIGIVLLQNTKINLIWRAGRTDAFDNLGRIAVTLQQISN